MRGGEKKAHVENDDIDTKVKVCVWRRERERHVHVLCTEELKQSTKKNNKDHKQQQESTARINSIGGVFLLMQ